MSTLLFGCANTQTKSNATAQRLQVGVSYGNRLLAMDDRRLGQALDDAVTLGAQSIRMDFSWPDIQPKSADEFNWGPTDRVVDEARRRGLHVLPILTYTPAWARPAECASEKCGPARPRQFAAWAGAASARYASRGLHSWEIWNEPNSAEFWAPKPDPAAYAHLVNSASAAIRGADPDAVVVLGGLASLASDGDDLSIADFLSGAPESPLQFVDAVAIHPYTYPYAASQLGPWTSPRLPNDSGLPYIKRVLAVHGVPYMPIWITEYGAPTGGAGTVWDGLSHAPPVGADHVTEALQATIAADAVRTAAADPAVVSLFWYTDRDLGSLPGDPEGYYGLRRVDGSEKPAFASLRDTIRGS